MEKPTSTGDTQVFKPLRVKAEEILHASPTAIAEMEIEDVQRLVEELQIYQIELELQNKELLASEVELAETRDRLANLYDFAPVGYLTLDRASYIMEANMTAAKILQLDRAQLVGTPLSKYMRQDEADLLHKHLMRAFESNSQNVCVLQLNLLDNIARNVRLESVISNTGKSSLIRCVMSDVTELLQAEEAAERSVRLAALGTLAAGIAHEVNNPLWMISLQAEVALATGDRPDRREVVDNCLREIQTLVERGGRIVNSVLRFANGDASRKWASPIASCLNRARDNARHLASKKNVVVELEIPEGTPDVAGNPTEMEQVFINLLANAIKASDPSGRIQVSVSWDSEMLTVRVKDEGCGMSADQIKRIFDPFYTTGRKTGGTGLGLSVSHRIVEDHHGTIEFVSQSGKGTTATVRLPLAGYRIIH